MTNTILLKGDPIHKEGVAGGAITPGHLIARNSSNQLVVHPTASGDAAKLFAVEESYVGGEISDAYASADRVPYIAARPGDEVYAILADSQTVVVGDPLGSAGDGTLLKLTVAATTLANAIVAYAIEAVTTSGSTARIRVEVA